MNSVNLIGRLTRDPELRQTNSSALCKIGLALSRRYTVNGEKREETSFVDCVIWGKSAENAAQYMNKGQRVGVSGSLKQETWEKDGQKHSRLVVNVAQWDLLEKKENGEAPTSSDDGEIPF